MRKSLIAAILLTAVAGEVAPAAGQALPNQVLALYPQRTGELIFVDLQTLRASRHYPQIKSQVLPPSFRQLEQWAQVLGVDFETQVRQLSWGFLPAAQGEAIEFVGVAEGTFDLRNVEQRARQLKLNLTRRGQSPVVSLGRAEQGDEFVFAFLDDATAVFGWRAAAEEIVDRRAQGGTSLLNNAAVSGLLADLNGRAPLWVVLDKRFSGLALKQMLPEASQVPGFDAVAARIQSAWLRFELRDGLRGQAALRCQDASDAMLFSTAAQAAVALQSTLLTGSNPELARALSQMRLDRQNEQLNMEWTVGESDLVALLAKNSLTLKF